MTTTGRGGTVLRWQQRVRRPPTLPAPMGEDPERANKSPIDRATEESVS